jgi:predicted PurR-regulated permease PerM
MTAQIAFSKKDMIETVIKLAILGVMFFATFRIIQPFVMPVLWGVIIAVAVNPLTAKISNKMGGRHKTVSILFALVVIAALIIPSILLILSSIDAVQLFTQSMENRTFSVPPPPVKVEAWPIIGEPLYSAWNLASSNLEGALQKFSPQLKQFAGTLLVQAGSGVIVVFMLFISVVIAAALLATAEKGSATVEKILIKFAGKQGKDIKILATATIRGVMQGVIGVAVLQSTLAAIGMVMVGVPAAGLWALFVLILAVIQLSPIIILGPIAVWVFQLTDTIPAVIFLIWILLVSGCDGVLKPMLMGRGVDAPMLVILIGALGGMMLSGIIGLFVGAIIVAICYTLFMAWIEEEPEQ